MESIIYAATVNHNQQWVSESMYQTCGVGKKQINYVFFTLMDC